MDDSFGNMQQQSATYSAFLQPAPYGTDHRRASIVSNTTATSLPHDAYPTYGGGMASSHSGSGASNGISPASTNSYQEAYAMPGLSSGGSTNPSVSPRAPHSPFSGSPLSAKSLQASELARLLTTNGGGAAHKAGFGGMGGTTGMGQHLQAQALSMHVPAGGYDSLITGAGYAYPPQVTDNAGLDNYLAGSDTFAPHAHLHMLSGSSASGPASRADFAWGGAGQPQVPSHSGGAYPGHAPLAHTNPPLPAAAGFSSFMHDRRASVAQSEGAMSAMSDYSNLNATRGFVGGLMTDEQTGWGAGSGMEVPSGFVQPQDTAQPQHQQGGYADMSFDSAPFGDISEEQLHAFLAENGGYSLPATGQLDGGFAQQQGQQQSQQVQQPQLFSQPQLHRASLPGFAIPQNQTQQPNFTFGRQVQFPVINNLAPPSATNLADATRSGSEQSDAELNGVSLAQIAGATAPRKEKKSAAGKKIAVESRRGSVAVIEYNPDEKAQKREHLPRSFGVPLSNLPPLPSRLQSPRRETDQRAALP